MGTRRLRLLALAGALAAVMLAPTPAQGDDVRSQRADFAEQIPHHAVEASGHADGSALSHRLVEVGHIGFGPEAISDVWAHRNHAYLAGLGGTPVQIVDISDPRNPVAVATAPSPDPDCSLQDVKVATINTRAWSGDLMAVGGEGCFTGLQLWDVTNPASPVLLSAKAEFGEPEFIHNLFIYQRGGKAYVAAVSGFNEIFTGIGDVLIVDVTDPTNPVTVGDWGAGKDGGMAYGTPFATVPPFPPGSDCTPPPGGQELCRGEFFPAVYAHDVWVNTRGTVAYISYWDAGLILLDISNPRRPRMIGQGIEPPTFGSDEGDAHVAVPAHGGDIVVVGDETYTDDPFGFARVFDTSDATNPHQISAFATENTLNASAEDGLFSAHNVIVKRNWAYWSWYDDGIRVFDISNPTAVREVAAFSPGGGSSFWGVYVHRNLVLGSDYTGGGLYILQLR